MENNYILEWLEEVYPNTLPLTKISEYELGILIGQRLLIENLKIKLEVDKPIEKEIR